MSTAELYDLRDAPRDGTRITVVSDEGDEIEAYAGTDGKWVGVDRHLWLIGWRPLSEDRP